jgi:hypothetical protein
MRTRTLLVAAGLFATFLTQGQGSFLRDSVQELPLRFYPQQPVNVAISLTDFAANLFSIEGQYTLNRNAVIVGLGVAFGSYDVGGDNFETNNKVLEGLQVKANHKYYLAKKYDAGFVSFVHGPAFQNYGIDYETLDWVSFIEDGVTYYRLDDVIKTYSVNRFIYDARIHYEYYSEYFFYECGFGFSYRAVVNQENRPEDWNLDDMLRGIAHEGLRPSIMIKAGLNF